MEPERPANFFDHWGQKPKEDKGNGYPKKRLGQIAELLKTADSVIHAGDPDDEGQYLIDEIIQWCHYKGPVYRINTADTTQHALQHALANLKDNKPMEKIGLSAYARSVADFMVGINMTRYFTLNNDVGTLSIGRVQTPTLGLVVQRDMQIEGHHKVKYYTIQALLDIDGIDVPAKYTPYKKDENLTDGRILEKSYAESKVAMLRQLETISPINISYKEVKESAPLPFNLVELQSYCSKKFGYTPQDVMEITQSLRDDYKAITYNRSDCQYLSEEQYKEAPQTMQQVIQNIGFSPKGLDMSQHPRCYNDSNITAHTAIIPTNQVVPLDKLDMRQKSVYLAICKYFMAQFMPPAVKGKTTLVSNLPDQATLNATSTTLLSPGYLYLFQKDLKDGDIEKEEKSRLSEIKQGTYNGTVKDTSIEEKETKPPSRYTMATLNKDMTRIAKYVDDPEIKELLLKKDKDKKGENGSIGTVATRASEIELLVKRGFIREDGKKHLISTEKGRELYRILPDELKKPDMTARWWVIQEDIKAGNAGPDALTDSVMEAIKRILATDHPKIDTSVIPKDQIKGKGAQREVIGICPRCGKPVIEGKVAYGCTGYKEGCKYVIWKHPKMPSMKNTRITANDAKKLVEGKRVLKKSLISGAGQKFEGYIRLEKDDPTSPYGPSIKIDPKKDSSGKTTKKAKSNA